MIPSMNIIAWANVAPWVEQRQIEQDLIISRALIELFNYEFLKGELRFRGGTALHKLHFPEPMRYSEDIDLVRTREGPVLADLGARIDGEKLAAISASFERTVLQRLGYLLCMLGYEDNARHLYERITVRSNDAEIAALFVIRADILEKIAAPNSGMIWLLALAKADLPKALIRGLGRRT